MQEVTQEVIQEVTQEVTQESLEVTQEMTQEVILCDSNVERILLVKNRVDVRFPYKTKEFEKYFVNSENVFDISDENEKEKQHYLLGILNNDVTNDELYSLLKLNKYNDNRIYWLNTNNIDILKDKYMKEIINESLKIFNNVQSQYVDL